MATPEGRDLLITDSGNFQSVLFSFDRDEPSYFPGRALAVERPARRDDAERRHRGEHHRVRPRWVVGDRRSRAVRAGRDDLGDSVILITVDGEILELATPKGTTSTVDTLEIGTIQTGYVSPSGDRLVVVGDTGSAIVDGSGAVLGTFPGGTSPRCRDRRTRAANLDLRRVQQCRRLGPRDRVARRCVDRR